MKGKLASLLALGLALVASCSPDELGAPAGCTSIGDCPLDQVCSRDTKSCIPEPPNRLIGGFRCTVQHPDDLQPPIADLSEVIATVGSRRFALPLVLCLYDEENIQLTIAFSRITADVTAFVNTYATIDFGRNDIGPDLDGHNNSVELRGPGDLRYATSLKGYIAGDDIFDYGLVATGYVDIELTPAVGSSVRFGASCPNGLADCGTARAGAGGATQCQTSKDDASARVCGRPCATSGECAAGNGVCTFKRCTQACQTDADCEASLRCAAPNTAGEGRGCTAR